MKIRSPFVTEKKALKEMQHSAFVNFFGALFNRSKRDYSGLLSDPMTSSLLSTVLLWIARRWPEAPIYLTDKNDDSIYDHPMLDLMQHPNKFYSGMSLWFGTMLSVVSDGNGYWIKIKAPRDLSVRELWYVPHMFMEPKVSNGSNNFVDYYEYSPGGKSPIKIDPSDVVHFRYGIDPQNIRKGFSPLKSVIRDALTDEEADNFSASMLMNMGVPGMIVSPDLAAGQSASPEGIAATKKYFEEQFTGDKRGKPVVLTGPTKVQQFGFDPKSMDIAALRAIPEERVSAVTGIPAAVVGFGSGLAQTKVGATMKELREMAYEDGIIPIQRMIAPELETQLLAEFEPNPRDFKVTFDLSQVRVLQDDQDSLNTRTVAAFNGGVLYLDEARQAIGYESGPNDRIRRVPFSTTEVFEGQTVEQVTPPVPDPVKSRNVQTKGISRASRAFTQAQLRVYDRLRVAYSNDLVDGFETLADKIVDAYELYMSTNQLRSKVAAEKKTIEEFTAQEIMDFVVSAQSIMAIAESRGALINVLNWQGQYLAVAKATLNNVNAVFGLNLDLTDPMQREILSKGGRHFDLVGVTKQTQDAVYQALTEARSTGIGPREVARVIRSKVEGSAMYPGVYKEAYDRAIERGWSAEKAASAGDRAARQYRAEVISRTETKYAQNMSSMEIAKSSGTFNAMMVFDGIYGSPRSGEVDIASNGQVISFEDAQLVIDDEHPNGTLSLTPVIVEPEEIEAPLLGR